MQKFVEDPTVIKEFAAKLAATGGGDAPEDLVGGWRQALDLDWKAGTRVLIHITDAPCHGKKYHDCGDSYPSGDPDGLQPENLVRVRLLAVLLMPCLIELLASVCS